MKIVLLTGGIASGKSEVSAIMQDEGIPVYNADSKTKELYISAPYLLDEIEKVLETSLRDEDGVFNIAKMAKIIFTNAEKMEQVEQILFPYLMDDFKKFVSSFPDAPFVVIESATALEKSYFKGLADKVILVDAPFKTRLERACKRNKLSKEHVLVRMEFQKLMNAFSSGEEKPEKYGVDYVIINDSNLYELKKKTLNIINKI